MSEVQATLRDRSELLTLGHVVYSKKDGAAPDEEWESRDWQRYHVELLQMKYDESTTLRVRAK